MVERCGIDYVTRMLEGLGHWVNAADRGHLTWGILHFRKRGCAAMVKVDWARIEPAVFLSSAGVVLLVLGFGVADPARAKDLFLGLQDWIVGTWSWRFFG